jgi:putative oxidoreductase
MLPRLLEPKVDFAYPLLRIVAGFMFAFHGLQKLFGVLGSSQPAVGSQMWFGGVIELASGVAIAVGFLTPWTAFLASGTMAVAYVQFHWKLALGAQSLPTINRGELALLYAVVFFYIACRGGGAWSLDRRRARSGGS